MLQSPTPHAHEDLGPLYGIYFPSDALYRCSELALVVLCGGCAGSNLAGYAVASVGCEREFSYRERRGKTIRQS